MAGGIGLMLFVPFLGGVPLFDWDEINFAECAREMVVTGDHDRVTMNYAPFWEKPPLFFWLQASAMRVFGVSEFSARLPNAVVGAASLIFLYLAGSRLRGRLFGGLWAAVYAGSLLPFLYFKSGIIDPVFNLFIFSSFFSLYLSAQARKWAALGGILAGLAALTKGPVGLLLPGLAVVALAVAGRFRFPLPWKNIALYGCCALLTAASWFLYERVKHGPDFIVEFVEYQLRLLSTEDAGHGGFFGYHVVVLLFGCLPASFFALPGLFKTPDGDGRGFYRWNLALFWVVLAVFSLVKTKILHYSSLCYFPLTFVAAWELNRCRETGENALPRWRMWALAVCIGLIGAAAALLPWVGRNVEALIPYVKDPFAAENLKAGVEWAIYDGWPALLWLAGAGGGLVFMRRKKILRATALLFGATAAFLFFLLAGVVPKIERYTQGAAVDFFRSLQGKDVYVATLDYKSYAHYFYARVAPPGSPSAQALLNEPIDKPAYFSVKIQHAGRYADKLEKLYEKNGFAFFVRKPATSQDSLVGKKPARGPTSAPGKATHASNGKTSEIGVPLLRGIRHREYSLHHQNWYVKQDPAGYIYFANTDGLLIYDGEVWNYLQDFGEGAKPTVRSFAFDEAGNVYVGAINQFGVLRYHASGKPYFESLVDTFIRNNHPIGSVWETHCVKDGVYFRTPYSVFYFPFPLSPKKYFVVSSKTEFHKSFVVGGDLYMREKDVGVVRFKGVERALIPGGEAFAHEKVYGFFSWDNGEILAATQKQGLFIYKNKKFVPFNTEGDDFLYNSDVSHAIRLKDGSIAVATVKQGIAVFDEKGRIKAHYDETVGLPSNTVRYLAGDNQGGLWAALDGGLARIETPSPFSYFGSEVGLKGDVRDVIRYGDAVYTVGAQGMFRSISKPLTLSTDSKVNSAYAFFEPVEEFRNECWSLTPYRGDLLVGSKNGLFLFSQPQNNLLPKTIEAKAVAVGGDGAIYAATFDGPVYKIVKNNKSFEATALGDATFTSPVAMAMDGQNHLWVGTDHEGVYRWDGSAFNRYGTEHGLPDLRELSPFIFDGKLFCGSSKGVYRYERSKDRFSVDNTLFGQVDTTAKIVRVARSGPNRGVIIYFSMVMGAKISAVKLVGDYPKEDLKRENKQLKRLQNMTLAACYPESDGVVWLGGADGLVRYAPIVTESFPSPAPVVSRVMLSGDSVVVEGGGKTARGQKSSPLFLSYRDDYVRFECASMAYNDPGSNLYYFRLLPFDTVWRASKQNYKEYTNLESGAYVFEAKVHNAFGNVSEPGRFYFVIEAPVWEQWWFYVLEITFFATLFIISFYFGTRGGNERLNKVLIFSTIIFSLEFVLVLFDPFFDRIADGIPIFKWMLNVLLALVINPIEKLIAEAAEKRNRKVDKF